MKPDSEAVMLVISIPIGILVTAVIAIVAVVSLRRAATRRRRLREPRARQEAARLRALEKSLQPPLVERLRVRFWRRSKGK